jgi:hypothetical protein
VLDGQRYRVIREAKTYDPKVKPTCTSGSSGVQGTRVTVTVTWEGMSAGTKPHTAWKLFPPQPNAAVGLAPGQAEIIVTVTGSDKNGDGPRDGIKVTVKGPAVSSPTSVTNIFGCAVFLVHPDSAVGSGYDIILDGDLGGRVFVNPSGNASPSINVDVKPDEAVSAVFQNFSEAATLRVTVPTAEAQAVKVVEAVPMFAEGGKEKTAVVESNVATFERLGPGNYSIQIDGHVCKVMPLDPGGTHELTVTAPC